MSFFPLLWTFLPAFIANAVPVLLPHIPYLKHWHQPIAEKHLGKNKTWRGLVMGTLAAVLVAWLQYELGELGILSGLRILRLGFAESFITGFLLGFGALFGDAVKSFFKRRMGIAPGRAWPVIDGIDYMVGAIIFVSPFYVPSFMEIIILLVIGPLASLAANLFSYVVGWKNVWW